MEKQGWVSIWLGNIKEENAIGKYMNVTYDEDGESVPSKFSIDFHIKKDETDEDTIETAWYKNSSRDISEILAGCSYEEMIIPEVKKTISLRKSYNAAILIYKFEYNKEITSASDFDFITSLRYE